MSPNRKVGADETTEADRRFVEADPEADLARGRARPETPEREKIHEEGAILHEEDDPLEVDLGVPPRSPI